MRASSAEPPNEEVSVDRVAPPMKKKRGRPARSVNEAKAIECAPGASAPFGSTYPAGVSPGARTGADGAGGESSFLENGEDPPKKKRGRPSKASKAAEAEAIAAAVTRNSETAADPAANVVFAEVPNAGISGSASDAPASDMPYIPLANPKRKVGRPSKKEKAAEMAASDLRVAPHEPAAAASVPANGLSPTTTFKPGPAVIDPSNGQAAAGSPPYAAGSPVWENDTSIHDRSNDDGNGKKPLTYPPGQFAGAVGEEGGVFPIKRKRGRPSKAAKAAEAAAVAAGLEVGSASAFVSAAPVTGRALETPAEDVAESAGGPRRTKTKKTLSSASSLKSGEVAGVDTSSRSLRTRGIADKATDDPIVQKQTTNMSRRPQGDRRPRKLGTPKLKNQSSAAVMNLVVPSDREFGRAFGGVAPPAPVSRSTGKVPRYLQQAQELRNTEARLNAQGSSVLAAVGNTQPEEQRLSGVSSAAERRKVAFAAAGSRGRRAAAARSRPQESRLGRSNALSTEMRNNTNDDDDGDDGDDGDDKDDDYDDDAGDDTGSSLEAEKAVVPPKKGAAAAAAAAERAARFANVDFSRYAFSGAPGGAAGAQTLAHTETRLQAAGLDGIVPGLPLSALDFAVEMLQKTTRADTREAYCRFAEVRRDALETLSSARTEARERFEEDMKQAYHTYETLCSAAETNLVSDLERAFEDSRRKGIEVFSVEASGAALADWATKNLHPSQRDAPAGTARAANSRARAPSARGRSLDDRLATSGSSSPASVDRNLASQDSGERVAVHREGNTGVVPGDWPQKGKQAQVDALGRSVVSAFQRKASDSSRETGMTLDELVDVLGKGKVAIRNRISLLCRTGVLAQMSGLVGNTADMNRSSYMLV